MWIRFVVILELEIKVFYWLLLTAFQKSMESIGVNAFVKTYRMLPPFVRSTSMEVSKNKNKDGYNVFKTDFKKKLHCCQSKKQCRLHFLPPAPHSRFCPVSLKWRYSHCVFWLCLFKRQTREKNVHMYWKNFFRGQKLINLKNPRKSFSFFVVVKYFNTVHFLL